MANAYWLHEDRGRNRQKSQQRSQFVRDGTREFVCRGSNQNHHYTHSHENGYELPRDTHKKQLFNSRCWQVILRCTERRCSTEVQIEPWRMTGKPEMIADQKS